MENKSENTDPERNTADQYQVPPILITIKTRDNSTLRPSRRCKSTGREGVQHKLLPTIRREVRRNWSYIYYQGEGTSSQCSQATHDFLTLVSPLVSLGNGTIFEVSRGCHNLCCLDCHRHIAVATGVVPVHNVSSRRVVLGFRVFIAVVVVVVMLMTHCADKERDCGYYFPKRIQNSKQSNVGRKKLFEKKFRKPAKKICASMGKAKRVFEGED